MNTKERTGGQAHSKLWGALAFCVGCIALNVVGAQLALALNLPVYLDSFGTVLAAIVGGYVPGMLVGYLTNLINSATDPSAIYYGLVNVFIAIVVAFLAKKGWFKKLPLTMLAVLIVALVCGVLGSSLVLFLNAGGLGGDISSMLALQLYEMGVGDLAVAELLADISINLIDKSLVILFAVLVYHMFSDELLAKLDFTPWRQAPLSKTELDKVMSAKPRGVSLRTKFVVIVATIMVFVAIATTAFSYMTFHQSMIEGEAAKAQGITSLMANVVDPDRIDEFLEKGEAAPGYLETEAEIAKIRDSFDGVQYAYVYQIREDGCHVVLDPDTAEEPGSEPGDVVGFDTSFEKYLPTLLAGGEIEPIVSNETYGWLLTVYTPLKNSAGTTVAYLAVDISMAHLVLDEVSFIAGVVTLFAAFLIIVCAVVLWLARYNVIVPVNSIARASTNLMLGEESLRAENVAKIRALDIHTGDEIENLYHAVAEMSQEAVHYIQDVQEKNETISRMQSNLIMVMADLVESRDKFTGDHVRNTAAYARIIMNQMRLEGVKPDVLTNEFISNVYKSAPLHDVGKIVVSDAILNKPGRLTDEEFAIMKSHTIAGRDILESAKGAVSESSYLDEAQRLAAYHHEKWDGSGYPFGLAGEDIPLSARIMAVADVFDALVSKRSYKEGFPIEKAFAIIEEGIGTHFDPQVARPFLHAKDRARLIAERSAEKKRLEEEAARAEEEARAAQEAAEAVQEATGAKTEGDAGAQAEPNSTPQAQAASTGEGVACAPAAGASNANADAPASDSDKAAKGDS